MSPVKFSFLVLLCLAAGASAQNREWQVFAPADRSFRVEFPEGRISEISSEKGDGRNTFFERGAEGYLRQENERIRFAVYVLNIKEFGLSEIRKDEGWMDYLAVMTIGDDDESHYLSKPKKVNANGLQGLEYTYVDPNGPAQSFARGRFFDLNDQIYILVFTAASALELESPPAERFFTSFRLTPQLRRAVPTPKPEKGDIEFTKIGAAPLLTLEDANAPMLSEDGSLLSVFPEVNLVEVYEVHPRRRIQSFGQGYLKIGDDVIIGGAISGDGKRLLLLTGLGPIIVSSQNGEILARGNVELYKTGQRFDSARFVSSDLRFLVFPQWPSKSGPDIFGVLVSDLQAGRIVGRFGEVTDSHDHWDRPVITPDGRVLAATRSNFGNTERNLTVVWDRLTGRELLRLPFNSLDLELSADGRRLVTHRHLPNVAEGSDFDPWTAGPAVTRPGLHKYVDTTKAYLTEVWDLSTMRRIGELGAEFVSDRPWVRSVSLSANGKYVVTASHNYILVWDSDAGRLLAAQPTGGPLSSAKFSDNGVFIVSDGEGETVRVWRFADILRLAMVNRH